MAQGIQFDYLFKIVIVGDSGVGKTNLLSKYAHNSFQQCTKTTIGVELLMHTFQIEGKLIQSQIWDTAGQERFRAVTTAYYRNAVGVIMVFDLTKTQTFEHLTDWLKQVKAYSQPDISILVIGNKSDLEHNREVKEELVQDFIRRNRLSYIETSAKDGSNVQQAFKRLMEEVYKQQKNKEKGPKANTNIFSFNPNDNQDSKVKVKKGKKVALKKNCC